MGRRRSATLASVVLSSFVMTAFLLATPRVVQAGVHAALVPEENAVTAGTEFEVRVHVTQAGDEFNTYQTIVRFDPQKVTFLRGTPLSSQEGAYMTGACGETFHWFTEGTIEVGVVHSILCANMFLTGPGELYVLRFRAEQPGRADFTFQLIEFARAGILVPVSTSTNTSVTVDPTTPVRDHTWSTVKALYR